MTGNLCWFGDQIADTTCAECEQPVCRNHGVDSYRGILCTKCNDKELQAGFKRELKSFAFWIIFGTVVMIIVMAIATME